MLFCNFSQNITKVISIWRLKVGKNSTAYKKSTSRLKVTNKIFSNKTLKDIFRMDLANFVAFLVLKILYNLVSMENFSNANSCWHRQKVKNVQNDFTFIFNILSELRTGFVSFLVFLAVENVIFTKLVFNENKAA